MTLLEGHADQVMDAVGPEVVPSVKQIRERFEKRRDGGSPLDRLIRRLLGLDLKMQQYRQGGAFVRAVVDRVGVRGFNTVWESPQTLPTRAETASPAAWPAACWACPPGHRSSGRLRLTGPRSRCRTAAPVAAPPVRAELSDLPPGARCWSPAPAVRTPPRCRRGGRIVAPRLGSPPGRTARPAWRPAPRGVAEQPPRPAGSSGSPRVVVAPPPARTEGAARTARRAALRRRRPASRRSVLLGHTRRPGRDGAAPARPRGRRPLAGRDGAPRPAVPPSPPRPCARDDGPPPAPSRTCRPGTTRPTPIPRSPAAGCARLLLPALEASSARASPPPWPAPRTCCGRTPTPSTTCAPWPASGQEPGGRCAAACASSRRCPRRCAHGSCAPPRSPPAARPPT